MHLTKQQLKQIIKEELEQVVSEQDGELPEIFGMFKARKSQKPILEQLKKMLNSIKRPPSGSSQEEQDKRTLIYIIFE